ATAAAGARSSRAGTSKSATSRRAEPIPAPMGLAPGQPHAPGGGICAGPCAPPWLSRVARALLCPPRMKNLPTLVLAAALVAACDTGPDVAADQVDLITTGNSDVVVDPHSLGIVLIFVYNADAHELWYCTGALLTNDTVLTSANCIAGATPDEIGV